MTRMFRPVTLSLLVLAICFPWLVTGCEADAPSPPRNRGQAGQFALNSLTREDKQGGVVGVDATEPLAFEQAGAYVQGLKLTDLSHSNGSVVEYEGSQIIRISDELVATIHIEISSKGNGLMQVAMSGCNDLSVPIYDSHAEDNPWWEYEPLLLNYFFVDSDGDGVSELHIEGARVLRTETSLLERSQISNIYKFNPKDACWDLLR